MERQTIKKFADICFRVPSVHDDRIRAVAENILALIEEGGRGVSEADAGGRRAPLQHRVGFPYFHPEDTLKGARLMHKLTPAQLAAMIGVKTGHISEVEKSKRPVGKDMVRCLAKALNTSYKVFL